MRTYMIITHNQMHRTYKYSEQLNDVASSAKWFSIFYGLSSCDFESCCWYILSPSIKELLDSQANTESEFTLKYIRETIITYSEMHCTSKYLQYSSIIKPVCLNGWLFVYELSGCGFEPRCSQMEIHFVWYF